MVHPAAFTFKIADNVSFAAGAMVEPLAVGFHGAIKARVKPGDIGLVLGAGPIGLVTVIAAIASGCSRIIISDVVDEKLEIAGKLGSVIPVNALSGTLAQVVSRETDGWGVDVVFECSGAAAAAAGATRYVCPGGVVVFIGMPLSPISFDVVEAQTKEVRVEHVFRYANVYPRIVSLLGSQKINVDTLITETASFSDSVAAFEAAAKPKPTSVKSHISLEA